MEDNQDFDLKYDLALSEVAPDEFEDGEEEFYRTLDLSYTSADLFASSLGDQRKMETELEFANRPIPGDRFNEASEGAMDFYEQSRQSKATKTNTKWAVNILQDWYVSKFGDRLDTAEVSEEALASLLRQFYCEAKPQENKSRTKNLGPSHARTYHKNTMRNIRSGINRHFQDIGKNYDIIRGAAFKRANNTLDGLLKDQLRSGLSRPTSHKEIISENDRIKINEYFESAECCPIILRQAVWYTIAVHFVSRGLEFHQQLKTDSFLFLFDEHNSEYACLSHETQQKKISGRID